MEPTVRRRTTGSVALVALVAVFAMLLGGFAWGSIPSSTGVITACYKGGSLRLIDAEAGAMCRKDERLITWNQSGVSGYNTLIDTAGAASGAGQPCVYGGTRIAYGLDDGSPSGIARNGVLEEGEFDGTSYVCNGAPGEPAEPGGGGPSIIATADFEYTSPGAQPGPWHYLPDPVAQWTQAADGLDQLFVLATVTTPPTCTGGGSPSFWMRLYLNDPAPNVDNPPWREIGMGSLPAGSTNTIIIDMGTANDQSPGSAAAVDEPLWLFPPGAETVNTLNAFYTGRCDAAGEDIHVALHFEIGELRGSGATS